MTRRRKTEAYVQQKISFDAVTMARFSQIHWDPVLAKVKYGAVSQVMNKLLADYVNAVEAGLQPPDEIKSEASSTSSPSSPSPENL